MGKSTYMAQTSHTPNIQLYKASAGSGKTYRLSYAYISLLFQNALEKHPHRNTLAVTFTNKATDEMKRRIISELHQLSTSNSASFLKDLKSDFPTLTTQAIQDLSKGFLTDLLHDYSGFNVSTIDKFFQQIVRAFTREIGLQGNFTVELDRDKVLQSAIDTMLFELDKPEKRSLLAWLTAYSEEQLRDNKSWNISQNILQLGKELFKESYLQNLSEINLQLHDKTFLKTYRASLLSIIDTFETEMTAICDEAISIMKRHNLKFSDFSGASSSFVSYFDITKLKIKKFTVTDTFIKAANDITRWYTKTSPLKNEIEAAFHDGLGVCATKIVDADKTNYLSAKLAINHIYILGILSDISAQIKRQCDENNSVLINSTTEFLNHIMEGCDTPFIYEKTGVNIHHYMIDEFQDTSQLQWDNFRPLLENSIAENHRNLVVGDVKQSIYRFRNSDWSLLQNGVEKAFSGNVTKDTLDSNWRSAKNIVLFNNTFFELAPKLLANHFENDASKATMIEIYEDALQEIKKSLEGRVEINFISKDENKETTWQEKALELLPEKIDQLLAQGYSQRDITILVRRNTEATQIADFLLNCKDKQYEIISNEALLVGNAHCVKLLIAVMRYFVTPEDKLNRSLVELLYNQKTTNKAEIFANNETAKEWEQRVFEGDYASLPLLKNQPLFQLTEGLIQLLKLNENADNAVFLQAFQDEIFQFTSLENADINGFLSYWDEFSHKKFLAASETQDAIRIMTIHKSKGLEFKSVIIPFCDWDLDKSSNKSILWCKPKPDQQPFAQLPIIPVNYSQQLIGTIFADDYWEEKLRSYIDTINMTYVAFTRAENELIIMAPMSEKETNNQTIAKVLYYLFTTDSKTEEANPLTIDLPNYLNENFVKIGEQAVYERNSDVSSIENSSLSYDSVKITNRLKLRYHLNDEGSERQHGLLMHDLLSQINSVEDVDKVLKKLVLTGEIKQTDVAEINEILNKLFGIPHVKSWFSGTYKVLNEAEIITPQGQSYRPDRLMIKDNHVIVVDYKFGQQKEEKYKRQVGNYLRLIAQMGYQATGFIVYASLGEIESV